MLDLVAPILLALTFEFLKQPIFEHTQSHRPQRCPPLFIPNSTSPACIIKLRVDYMHWQCIIKAPYPSSSTPSLLIYTPKASYFLQLASHLLVFDTPPLSLWYGNSGHWFFQAWRRGEGWNSCPDCKWLRRVGLLSGIS